MVQKKNIDTFHKEGKSHRVITERCGSSQSAVSKHIKCKVDWKKLDYIFHLILEIKVPESGGRGERHRIHVAWSSVQVQCEVSTVCDNLGCHVFCWCWSNAFSEVHSQRSHLPEHFRALHASFCWQSLWWCWFNFNLLTLPKVPKAGSMTMVLLCLIGQQTHLTWTP